MASITAQLGGLFLPLQVAKGGTRVAESANIQHQTALLREHHSLRLAHFSFLHECFARRSTRWAVDCQVEQLRLLAETSMFLSGFAVACLVELPIPEDVDADSLGVGLAVLAAFSLATALTVALFTTCR